MKEGLRILVMDDEDVICKVTTLMFSGMGHHADAVYDGDEAVNLYKQSPYDLIIMDLTIPGGKGGEATVVRILELDPDAKVVVASGFSEDPIMKNFRQYGFVDCIAKPYKNAQLKELLERLF